MADVFVRDAFAWRKVYGKKRNKFNSKEKKLFNKYMRKSIVSIFISIMLMYVNAYLEDITDYIPILNISRISIVVFLALFLKYQYSYLTIRERLTHKRYNNDIYEFKYQLPWFDL
jgi:hypothetical protein